MGKILSREKGIYIYEVDNEDIVDYIEKTVLQYNGKGFVLQVLPEITKHESYEPYTPLFGKEKYAYRRRFWESSKPELHSYELFAHIPDVDWNAIISKVCSSTASELPKGIVIKKSKNVVLWDSRIQGKGYVPGTFEGRRVYISVSDDYAAKIFKEVYTDIGLPFRDRLLTKYEHILKEMALLIQNFEFYHGFFVDDTYVGASSCIATKVDHYINTNQYEENYAIPFEKFDMMPLESLGQKYGMVLAIIETLKKYYPKYSNAIFTIQYGFYCCGNSQSIKVNIEIPPQPVVKIPKKLNEW